MKHATLKLKAYKGIPAKIRIILNLNPFMFARQTEHHWWMRTLTLFHTLLWTCQHAQLSRLLDVMRNMHTLGCTEVSKHKIRIHLDPIYLWEFRCQCKKCWFWHHDGTVGCYVLRLYRQHHSVCCYGFRCPLPSFPVNSQGVIITGTQLTLLYPDHYKEINISND